MFRKEFGRKIIIWTLSAAMLAAPLASSVTVYAETINVNEDLSAEPTTEEEPSSEVSDPDLEDGKEGGYVEDESKEEETSSPADELMAKVGAVYNEEEQVNVAGDAVEEAAGKVKDAQGKANQDLTDTQNKASGLQTDAAGIVSQADSDMGASYSDLGDKTISQAVADADQAFSGAVADITDGKRVANEKLEEIQGAVAEGTTDKWGMLALADDADKAAVKAEGALVVAENALGDAKAAYEKAALILETAQGKLNDLLQGYEELAGQMEEDVDNQKQAAEDAIKAAGEAVTAAEGDLAKAKAAYDEAVGGLGKVEKEVTDARRAASLAAVKADQLMLGNGTQRAIFQSTFAGEQAKRAEGAAVQAGIDAEIALARYKAAVEAVNAAKEKLEALSFKAVTIEKQITLQASLKEAEAVCSQAKEKYEAAYNLKATAEEDAASARAAATEAKRLADAVIVPAVANGTAPAPGSVDKIVIVGGKTVSNSIEGSGTVLITSSVREGIAAGVATESNTIALADNQIPLADGEIIIGGGNKTKNRAKDSDKSKSKKNDANNNVYNNIINNADRKHLTKLGDNDIPLASNVDFESENFNLKWLIVALIAAALIGFGTYKYQMGRKEPLR